MYKNAAKHLKHLKHFDLAYNNKALNAQLIND